MMMTAWTMRVAMTAAAGRARSPALGDHSSPARTKVAVVVGTPPCGVAIAILRGQKWLFSDLVNQRPNKKGERLPLRHLVRPDNPHVARVICNYMVG